VLVRVSLAVDASQHYQHAKAWVEGMLNDDHNPHKKPFDLFIIAMVLISIGILLYGVKNPMGAVAQWFENAALGIFVVEYLLRLWVCCDVHQIILRDYERATQLDLRFRPTAALKQVLAAKWRYIRSPMAVIDLLAILPSYRSVRLLRVFMLFRLFKLFRYTRTVQIIADIIAEKRFDLYTLFMFAGFMVLAGASAIYLFEGDLPESGVDNFFDAVYWAVVTLSTVGYGDISPVTSEGRLVAMMVIATGIGVFAFSTSIIVSAFQDRISEMREYRVMTDLDRRTGYTVVCGYGRLGQAVVQRLAEEGVSFVIVEKDPQRIREATAQRYLAVQGDAADSKLMENLGLRDRAAAVLCVTDDDVTNVFVTVSARSMNPALRIIASANRSEVANKLRLAGADYVATPFQTVGMVGAEYAGQPIAFETFYNIIADSHGVVIEGIRIPLESKFDGCPIVDLDLRRHGAVLFGIISISDQGSGGPGHHYPLSEGMFHYNPPADYCLHARDIVVVFGHEYSMQRIRRLLEIDQVA